MNRMKGFRKIAFIGIGIAVLLGSFLNWKKIYRHPVIYHDYIFVHPNTKLSPCSSDDPLGVRSAKPCQPSAPSFNH
jgi:hypothetical protein